jgi:hypothetical protein
MTLQLNIDEKILAEIDENLRFLHKDRDTFLREGVATLASKLRREAEVAAQYRAAYGKQPQTEEELRELDEWNEIADLGDDWKEK